MLLPTMVTCLPLPTSNLKWIPSFSSWCIYGQHQIYLHLLCRSSSPHRADLSEDTHTQTHSLCAWVTSQPAVGCKVSSQLLDFSLCERLKRWSTGAAMETKPLHRLLEGGNSQLPGHLATQSTGEPPYTPPTESAAWFQGFIINTLQVRHI